MRIADAGRAPRCRSPPRARELHVADTQRLLHVDDRAQGPAPWRGALIQVAVLSGTTAHCIDHETALEY